MDRKLQTPPASQDGPPKVGPAVSLADIAVGLAILAAFAVIAFNVHSNMLAAGIRPGFAFLSQQAGFDLSETIIPYGANDTYLRAIFAGLANTVVVAVASLVIASLAGLLLGLLSVSTSPVARYFALAYIELFRNLPKILVLLIIFVAAVNGLPTVRQALVFGPFTISNRAIYLPWLSQDPRNTLWLFASLFLVCALIWLWTRHASRRQALTGRRLPVLPVALALCVAVPAALAVALNAPLGLSWPALAGFSVEGGVALSIQFCTVAVALGLYHGAQIAEVLRGGIEGVAKGQIEAAAALGLKSGQTTRLIVVPQVLRTVVPPLNNQFANLLKNTSISIAVGYSDLMSVAGTAINQTFRPLETMLITMSIYLLLCLALTGVLNHWNARTRAREGRGGR
ncbi:ABC transporter permease subunit [Ensifer sp. 2YAB10]|uniref:ABC transporter permease subunit n=1 Tax=unclassified Ensifer TaxID=2633371 RepID=UPI003F8F9581